MRYSRIAQSPKTPPKRNYATMVLFILLIGAGVYIFCATAAGGWVADHVVTPVFSYLDSGAKKTGINDLPAQTKNAAAASASAKTTQTAEARVTQTVSADSKSYYLLQAGVFENEQNAKDAATALAARGGAGYVYKDGAQNRVLLAAYKTESEAKSVRDSLQQKENIATYVFNISMDGLKFNITAGGSQAQALKDAIALPQDTADKLMALSVSYDKGTNIDADIKTLKQKCASVADSINAAVKDDEKNEAIVRLKEFMKELCENINKLPDNAASGNVEISSQLKYTVIWVAIHYSDLMKNMV